MFASEAYLVSSCHAKYLKVQRQHELLAIVLPTRHTRLPWK
jgi:hypothetical protein